MREWQSKIKGHVQRGHVTVIFQNGEPVALNPYKCNTSCWCLQSIKQWDLLWATWSPRIILKLLLRNSLPTKVDPAER